ncbi:hypothetical protein EVAR_37371_1 [Eumeta japonica]|uniref:Uncharacterized protein n=1 Tax=Eumeta variegata TaxID=151549 RepID=A0A4C1ZUY4_EUMVA|nr:hypothetical protein EVAR_37371_1 [Eumeta japonica]
MPTTRSNHGRKGDTSAARVQPIAIGAPPVMESPESPSETTIAAPTTVPATDVTQRPLSIHGARSINSRRTIRQITIAQAKERLARAEAELARASLERIEAESALSEDDAASQIDKAAMVKEWAESQHPEEYEALPPITAPAAHTQTIISM